MPQIKALFFDMDGVIIDTEKDGHRIAFNKAFKEFGYNVVWTVEFYHELLQISGGKERIRLDMSHKGFFKKKTFDEMNDLIMQLHKRKTQIFISMIKEGKLPLRSGIKRFMKEAMAAGLILSVCTTANEKSAAALIHNMLPDIDFSFVLAGDVVSNKKPHPEIYQLALKKAGVPPLSCLVIEDSQNGVASAKGAGLLVLATTNVYTKKEYLSLADIVVNHLGGPGDDPVKVKMADKKLNVSNGVSLSQLKNYFS